MTTYRLPMDSRSRIALGKLVKNEEKVTSFIAHREGNKIILEPQTEVPAGEAWLFQNTDALESVKKGLAQKAEHDLGSFAEFADDEL